MNKRPVLNTHVTNALQFANIETTAVNTRGLWYAYVSINSKNVYQGKKGFIERAEAVDDGIVWLDAYYKNKCNFAIE